MTPKLNHIYQGDAAEVLRRFDDECIDCVVTSPPYWSLRNYVGIELSPVYCEIAEKRLAQRPIL